jgi:predicted RNA binding protein YcfA (HicA-like mRNA interferase family)
VKVRDVLKMLRKDGWVLRNQEGSHRQFVHPTKPGKVTVAGHESDEMPPKTHKSIMKQAGFDE